MPALMDKFYYLENTFKITKNILRFGLTPNKTNTSYNFNKCYATKSMMQILHIRMILVASFRVFDVLLQDSNQPVIQIKAAKTKQTFLCLFVFFFLYESRFFGMPFQNVGHIIVFG